MKVSVRELKNRLSEYLRRAAAGEDVTVTSHKRVVAKLVPPDRIGERTPPEYTVEALSERLKAVPWIRWSGGKPRLRAGITLKGGKRGEKTVAESLLDDRR